MAKTLNKVILNIDRLNKCDISKYFAIVYGQFLIYTITRNSEKNACERLRKTRPSCSNSDDITANKEVPDKSAYLGENSYKATLFAVSHIETFVDLTQCSFI